jgi:5-methylcytosine-specific restriction protein B
MAEVLFVYHLPAGYNITGPVKRQKNPEGPLMAARARGNTRRPGIGDRLRRVSGGVGFHTFKWASISFLISFARRRKQASQAVRDQALADPWAFREFVAQIPTDGGGNYGRESLLYLVPEAFERIFSGGDKWRLANELQSLVDDDKANVDRRIAQIAPSSNPLRRRFDFYSSDGARALWKLLTDPLSGSVYWASRYHELARSGPRSANTSSRSSSTLPPPRTHCSPERTGTRSSSAPSGRRTT